MKIENQITDINNELENEYFLYSTHKNSPSPIIFDVIKRTSKAVQVKNTELKLTCWIPKSAFQLCDLKLSLTLKNWFRGAIDTKYYQKKALGLVC